jgi:hypothetical protein
LIFSQPAIQQQMREMQDQMLQKMVDKGKIPQDVADKQREIGEAAGKIMPYVGAVFSSMISPFWWGLIIWSVGVFVFKGQFTFMKAVEVAGLANAIAVLGALVTTLLSISLSNLLASPSPALFIKHFDPQNPSHSLLAVFNIMTLWVLGVRAVGLARLSGVSFVRAGAWVFGIWAFYTGLLLAVGMAVSKVFSS